MLECGVDLDEEGLAWSFLSYSGCGLVTDQQIGLIEEIEHAELDFGFPVWEQDGRGEIESVEIGNI